MEEKSENFTTTLTIAIAIVARSDRLWQQNSKEEKARKDL